jgi:hypothetical protein
MLHNKVTMHEKELSKLVSLFHTFRNSATLAAHCCCSKELEFPFHKNIEFLVCRTKQSVELKDVGT